MQSKLEAIRLLQSALNVLEKIKDDTSEESINEYLEENMFGEAPEELLLNVLKEIRNDLDRLEDLLGAAYGYLSNEEDY